MTVLTIYLLKVLLCSGILYLYYHFFLRTNLFHHWNRFYLLSATALSLLLPCIEVDLFQPSEAQNKALQLVLLGQTADNYLEEFVITYNARTSTEQWLWILYGTISLVMFFAILLSLYRIITIIRSHSIRWFCGIRLITTNDPGAPFSFLNYIFWNENISLGTITGRQIFQHELAHVKERHTWDKLYLQVLIALFWFNPFFWLIRRELKHIHEFIADKNAVGDAGTEAFAAMILQTVYPQRFQSITNQFFQSSIKRRLFMLTQVKNPRAAYLTRVIALPLVAVLVLAFTARTKEHQAGMPNDQSKEISVTDTIPKNKAITAIDIRKNKDNGANEISLTYADGTKEVLSEKEAMEKGLINNHGSNLNGRKNSTELRSKNEELANPLYIVDEKEVTKEVIGKLLPTQIESINVWKGQHATDKYGNKGQNGVIEIKTKKAPGDESQTPQGNNQNADNITNSASAGQDVNLVTVIGHKKNPASQNDPVFEKAEFEASVNADEWRRFLEQNTVKIVQEVGKIANPGKYTVFVQFIVERDGTLSNFKIVKDPGYNLGNKVLDIMKDAPKWKPAIQNQKVVRSYHTQPITFVISTT